MEEGREWELGLVCKMRKKTVFFKKNEVTQKFKLFFKKYIILKSQMLEVDLVLSGH